MGLRGNTSLDQYLLQVQAGIFPYEEPKQQSGTNPLHRSRLVDLHAKRPIVLKAKSGANRERLPELFNGLDLAENITIILAFCRLKIVAIAREP